MKIYLSLFVLIFVVYTSGQDNSTTETPVHTTKVVTQPPKPPHSSANTPVATTTISPEEDCARRNASCKECLKSAQCLWCNSGNKCLLYPAGDVLPHADLCPLDAARWGVCWVNFEVLIIVMACLGVVILLSLAVCICCCCCRKKSSAAFDKEDAKFERKKMERKAKSDEKRAERKKRTDEIRRKYGLIKDDNPYQRFDEQA